MRPKNTTRQRFALQRARRLEAAAARRQVATDADLFGRMTDADPAAREAENLRQAAQIAPITGQQAALFSPKGYNRQAHRELRAQLRQIAADLDTANVNHNV